MLDDVMTFGEMEMLGFVDGEWAAKTEANHGPDSRTCTGGRVKAFDVEAIEEINERDARPETELDAARDRQRIGAALIEESGGGFADDLIRRAAVEISGESPSEPNKMLGRAAVKARLD
jgi:hypothetical protein